jgi:uncharacterized protein YndB with AHSA1/START domain
MKIELRSDKPMGDADCKAETGRTPLQWYEVLDAFGGPDKGRRELGNHLHEAHKVDPWWSATINVGYEAAHGLKEKDGRARGYTICATKSIKAAPEACYAQFASAQALDGWLGAGHVLDFKEGGSLDNADGNRAAIRKISPGKTIKLLWQQADAAPDTPVEIKFQPAGVKATVMITHERLQNRADADGLRRAWGEALERLKARLESA